MSVTAIEILNTILDNSTSDYLGRIPVATLANLKQVGDAITADKNIMNEFMTAIINKIALTSIKSKMYTNPLARLKQGSGRPMGNTIEELFVNPATDQGYDPDGTKLLKTTKPDGKACYFGLNRQSTYPISIFKADLKRAFNNERSFMSFYDAMITSLYSGDQIDEFNLTKGMLAKNIDNGSMTTIEVDISAPKEVAKAMSNIADYFAFAGTNFNGYNLVNKDKIIAGEKKCVTFVPQKNQVLLMRADVANEINYEVLATLFHMEVTKLEAMTIKIDEFPTEKFTADATHRFDTYAVLCDREAINVIDDVFETDNQYIGSSMMWNVWLQHWQWLYLSMFANAVAFGKTVTITA